jgi:sporulation protein YpjB
MLWNHGYSKYERAVGRILTAAVLLSLFLFVLGCEKETRAPANSVAVTVEETAKIQALDRTAGELYQLTMSGSVAEARERLKLLGEQMTQTEFHGFTGVEGVKALSDAILLANRKYNAVRYSPDEALAAARTIRLITDAMTHPNEPMWHQYIKPVQEDVNRLRKAAEAKNDKEASGILAELRQRYQVFRPAIFVKHPASIVEKLDSLFVFLQRETDRKAFGTDYAHGLKQMEETLNALYGIPQERTAYLPLGYEEQPVYWTLGIGGVLASVLGFVAWKMLRSGKRIARVRRKENGTNRE